MAKIAFIGLGFMGFPMAGHLARAGNQVTVYNRTASKAEVWVSAHGGKAASTPSDAAAEADFVFSCVGNDNDLREVTTGKNGAFRTMPRDGVFVDHTTTSAEVARELYHLARQNNLHFIDAPVSGGQLGAEKGILTIMAGGDADIYARALPLLQNYGKSVQHIGDAGYGQLCKMVNQICIVGIIQSLAEALNFGQAAGLDMSKVLSAISGGAASSWQMHNRAETMLQNKFDFGFAVDWMRKDIGICLEEAKRNGTSLPIAALIDQFYADVQKMGGNRLDTSSLIKRLANK